MELCDIGTLKSLITWYVPWDIGMLVYIYYNKLTFIQQIYEGPIYNMI